MRYTIVVSLVRARPVCPVIALAALFAGALACGGPEAGGGDTSETELEAEATTSGESGGSEDSGGPELPELPACWEELDTGEVLDAWGPSVDAMLLATADGLVRLDGNALELVAEGPFETVWATDLDHGWLARPELVGGEVLTFEGDVLTSRLEPPGGQGSLWPAAADAVFHTSSAGMLRFNGQGWDAVDAVELFGVPAPAAILARTADEDASYAQVMGETLRWTAAGGSALDSPTYTHGLFSALHDGRLLAAELWCDLVCANDAYVWSEGGGWVYEPELVPYFVASEFEALVDYATTPAGRLWALSSDREGTLRVAGLIGDEWVEFALLPSVSHGLDAGLTATLDGLLVHDEGRSFRAYFECLLA